MRVYIGGDSWGCGEWRHATATMPYTNTHRGLEQFLLDDGHTVTNNSISGGGNVQTYDQLARTRHTDYDTVILFQTISIRDNGDWDTLLTYKDFLVRNEALKAEHFKKLGELPHAKICMLGGLEKVHKEQIAQYPNLVPLIESIPELLTKGAYTAATLRCPISIGAHRLTRVNFHDQISKNADIDVLDKMIEASDYWQETVASHIQYFQPDGKHPNRRGHRQIYNIFKQQFKN